jgi:CHAT domain-containing protein
VLSACQSGLSLALEGEEWLGLPRAFLKAGAARVLASLWDVDDQTTRDLMARFVRAWWSDNSEGNRVKPRGKRPPAEALRMAQTALLAGNRHPYFWAGFQLVGAP